MKCTSKHIVGYWHYGVLLTYASLICGVVGTAMAALGRPGTAMLILLAAGLLDGVDGAIARTRKNRTIGDRSFGIQIDSLSDLVSFGILPVMIGFSMGLKQWYFIVLYCLYVLCALVRLAHYNVKEISELYAVSPDAYDTAQTQEEADTDREAAACGGLPDASGKPAKKYYEGMPVTEVALVMPIFYFCATMAGQWSVVWAQVIMAVLYVVYPVLMVMRFKLTKPRIRTLIFIVLGFLIVSVACFLVRYYVCDIRALDMLLCAQ